MSDGDDSRTSGGTQHTHEIVAGSVQVTEEEALRLCARYFDLEADSYDAFDDEVAKRRLYCEAVDRRVAERLALADRCDRILSFGCGTGRREVGIARVLNPRPMIIGVDQAAGMQMMAAARGLTMIRSLADPAAPPRSSVDAALCLSSFVHLPSVDSRRRTLDGLFDLLVPGGVLILDVFNINDVFEWGSQILSSQSAQPGSGIGTSPGDVLYRRIGHSEISYMHYFSLEEVKALLESAGFIVESVVGVGYGRDPGRIGVPLDTGCLLFICRKTLIPEHAATQ